MVDVNKRAQKKNNIECLSDKLKEKLDGMDPKERLRYMGYGNGKKIEPIPNFIQADCEKVISGENNTWITLGRDRPGSIATGYGGSGDSHAGAIDICVGRANKYARSTDTDCTDAKTDGLILDALVEEGKVPEELLRVNNDFLSDAARIYISQKTDIDYNFGICQGRQLSPKPRSAIAMKADLLRFVARESVKIVTRSDDKNSQGGDVDVIGGVDIIAGNVDDRHLQPMVKGEYLKELLTFIINDLNRITQHLHQQSLSYQSLEKIVMNHVHIDPLTGVTGPSPEVMIGTAIKSIQDIIVTYPTQISLIINGVLEEFEYLKRFGSKSILSSKNNVN